jgi:hypothetical protein
MRRERYEKDPEYREKMKAASRISHEKARREAGIKPRAKRSAVDRQLSQLPEDIRRDLEEGREVRVKAQGGKLVAVA